MLSTRMPAGQALIGDLPACMLWMREDMQVQVSETHSDMFQTNRVQVRAELRAAFGISQPEALIVAALTGTTV